MGPWGEQLLLRIKWHAFTLYDITQYKTGCPHSGCIHLLDSNLYHVFWECRAAVALRHEMTQPWRRLGLQEDLIDQAIFSTELPSIQAGFWELAETMLDKATTMSITFIEAVTDLAEGCWRIGVAIVVHSVWRWRVNHFDEHNNVTEHYHKAALASKLRNGYNTVHLHMKAQLPTRFQQQIIDVLHRATMSYASKTAANNVAENMGLLIGLKACAAKRYEPLHVIGDSEMIIRQQRGRKPPKVGTFTGGAGIAPTLEWHHHVRKYSKMADKLANMAMDSRRRVQMHIQGSPTKLLKWESVIHHLGGDVAHWQANQEGATQDGVVGNSP